MNIFQICDNKIDILKFHFINLFSELEVLSVI